MTVRQLVQFLMVMQMDSEVFVAIKGDKSLKPIAEVGELPSNGDVYFEVED